MLLVLLFFVCQHACAAAAVTDSPSNLLSTQTDTVITSSSSHDTMTSASHNHSSCQLDIATVIHCPTVTNMSTSDACELSQFADNFRGIVERHDCSPSETLDEFSPLLRTSCDRCTVCTRTHPSTSGPIRIGSCLFSSPPSIARYSSLTRDKGEADITEKRNED